MLIVFVHNAINNLWIRIRGITYYELIIINCLDTDDQDNAMLYCLIIPG